MPVQDALALGVIALAVSFIAYCLVLDPRPCLAGEGSDPGRDALFFLPYLVLVGSVGVMNLDGIFVGAPELRLFHSPLGSALWLAVATLALALVMRWLYSARLGWLRTGATIAGVTFVLLMTAETSRRLVVSGGDPAVLQGASAPGSWLVTPR